MLSFQSAPQSRFGTHIPWAALWWLRNRMEPYMTPLKLCRVTANDLLTIIEDVGFDKAMIAGADERGIVIDGYLDLASIADRVNSLIEVRARSRQLIDHEQPR